MAIFLQGVDSMEAVAGMIIAEYPMFIAIIYVNAPRRYSILFVIAIIIIKLRITRFNASLRLQEVHYQQEVRYHLQIKQYVPVHITHQLIVQC